MAGELALSAGGFSAGLDAATPLAARPEGAPAEYLLLRLRALAANLRPALELAGRLLREADFRDEKRLEDQLLELRNDFKASLVPAGSHYAALRAGSRFSPALRREESWEGVTQLLHVGGLAGRLAERRGELVGSLEAIRRAVFSRDRLVVNLTCGGAGPAGGPGGGAAAAGDAARPGPCRPGPAASGAGRGAPRRPWTPTRGRRRW